jgi:hypothetical protein
LAVILSNTECSTTSQSAPKNSTALFVSTMQRWRHLAMFAFGVISAPEKQNKQLVTAQSVLVTNSP